MCADVVTCGSPKVYHMALRQAIRVECAAMLRVPESFRQRMGALYGAEGEAWLAKLPELVAQYARRWSLSIDAPYDTLSYNLVIRVRGADETPLVLKVGLLVDELSSEIEALRLYDGRGCAKLVAAQPDEGVFLLERLVPGVMLVSVQDDEEATRVAAHVMQELWRPLPEEHPFVTTTKWAEGMQRLRARFDGECGPFPRRLVEAAEQLFGELLSSSQPAVLLHGDLHHYNILAAKRAPWLAIDPKGLGGEPLYETGALLRNPMPQVASWPALHATLERRVSVLSEALQADRKRIVGWGMAQAVLSSWWNFEDEGQLDEGALFIAQKLLEIYERS